MTDSPGDVECISETYTKATSVELTRRLSRLSPKTTSEYSHRFLYCVLSEYCTKHVFINAQLAYDIDKQSWYACAADAVSSERYCTAGIFTEIGQMTQQTQSLAKYCKNVGKFNKVQ